MSKKLNVITIDGDSPELFKKVFRGYVSTGEEDSSEESDFRGSLDRDGKFYIVKKGHENNQSLNYEARLTGEVRSENGKTVVEYSVAMSRVFELCFYFISALFIGLWTYAIIGFINDGSQGTFLFSSFCTVAFLIMLLIYIIKPDCKAVEKCMDKICEEYVSVIDK